MIIDNKLLTRTVLLGILCGLFFTFCKGTLVMLLVIFFTALILKNILPEDDKKFLMVVFISGITIRIAIFFVIYIISIAVGRYGELTPDSRLYFLKALETARSMTGVNPFPLQVQAEVGKSGFLYMLSFFYILIGYNPPVANPVSIFSDKLINCLIGTLTGIPIFYLAKGIFGKKVAKISCCLAVFFPSIVLWSITNNRDTINIFLVSLILFTFLKSYKEKKIGYFILILLFLFLLKTIRLYIFQSVLFALVSTFLLIFWTNSKRKVVILLIFIVSAAIFLNFVPYGRQIRDENFNLQNVLKEAIATNKAVLSQGGSTYKIYDDAVLEQNTPVGFKFIWALIKGWFYFMLIPFPWFLSSAVQLFCFPQIIMWYLLLPFIFIGIIFTVRYKLRDSLIVLVYLFTVTSGFALMEGNVGSALRHRDLVSPFYFIFAAAGLVKFFTGSINFEKEK